MKWLLLIPLVTACAATFQYAVWPSRGPMLQVTNHTPHRRTIYLRDGFGRELHKTILGPERRVCFRWPFIDSTGYMLAAGRDTLASGRFAPWDADGWSWELGSAPVADPDVCR